MSVITRANKSAGQAIKSFSLDAAGLSEKEAETTATVAAAAIDPVAVKAQKMASIKADLLALNKTDRDQLLHQLFASDLEQIVKMEQKKGVDQGLNQAKEQWQRQEQQLRADLEQQQQLLLKDLSNAVTTFSAAKPTIEISNEAILLEMVYSAVLKIIEVQLSDSEYVREVIRSLAEEFSGQETLELCLCSRDLHILNELNLQSLLPANMKVTEEDNLLPGSYRIHIEGGAIESKLEDKLRNFKNLLIDTYSQREH